MELQEAIDVINEKLAYHDDKNLPMPSDCAAKNEDMLCCMDSKVWEEVDFVSKTVPNPFRVALDVVMEHAHNYCHYREGYLQGVEDAPMIAKVAALPDPGPPDVGDYMEVPIEDLEGPS